MYNNLYNVQTPSMSSRHQNFSSSLEQAFSKVKKKTVLLSS